MSETKWIDPIPSGAMTLDKVPEGVRCVCGLVDGGQDVVHRVGTRVYPGAKTHQSDGTNPKFSNVLHILDPLPEIAVTLDTLPVGRVIEYKGEMWFKDISEDFTRIREVDGCPLIDTGEKAPREPFTVTNIIMELKEVV